MTSQTKLLASLIHFKCSMLFLRVLQMAIILEKLIKPGTIKVQPNSMQRAFHCKESKEGLSCTTEDTAANSTKKGNQEKAVLVICDSMVRHINGNKIARAAQSKAVFRSYRTATVNQLARKFDENQGEEPPFDTIILHVGRNDLLREQQQTWKT